MKIDVKTGLQMPDGKMSKHTSGPWYVSSDDEYHVEASDGEGIALTPTEPSENDALMAEFRANARLIAAAPDLLDIARVVAGGEISAANMSAARALLARLEDGR